jgi:hypothetical protein
MESIATGVFSVVSQLASHSEIEVTKDYKLATNLFFCISGNVGTNKTGVVSLLQNSYIKMESMFKEVVDPNFTTCINACKLIYYKIFVMFFKF